MNPEPFNPVPTDAERARNHCALMQMSRANRFRLMFGQPLLSETATMNKPFERLRLNITNRPVDTIRYWHDRGDMDLNPPYQRGDVWGSVRQRNLIRSILLGIPIPAIVINDRASAGWDHEISCAVIDGKQRLTSILKFLLGELSVPGEWFGEVGDVTFNSLNIVQQRRFENNAIPFCEGQLPDLAAEKEVFELINFGGVPQGETDLE